MMYTGDGKEGFKKGIIIFWTLWWLVALWTDVVGLLAHYGLLIKSWAPDKNMSFLITSLKMYPLPDWAPLVFFLGILLWSLLATVTFIWTCAALNKDYLVWMRRADVAFILSIGLWFAFFISDQMVMNFDLEENHMVQGGFQLLTYLTLYLLPSKKSYV